MSDAVTNADIVEALAQSFNHTELDVLVLKYFSGGLESIGDSRAPSIYAEVVKHADRHSCLPDLVADGAKKRPGSALSRIAEQMLNDTGRRSDLRSEELVNTLIDLDVSGDLLLTAYRLFAPEDWIYAIDDRVVDRRRVVINKLAHLLDPLLLLRVVLYLTRILDAMDLNPSALYAWLDDARNKGVYSESAVKDAMKFVNATMELYRDVRLHLMIEIRPPLPGDSHYTVMAWRQLVNVTSDSVRGTAQVGDPQRCPEEGLERAVETLIRQMESERRVVEEELQNAPAGQQVEHRMAVELFLPLPFLARPVDQWQITVDPVPVTSLGLRHWVVVRSWERSYDSDYAATRRNWEYFWNLSKKPKSMAVSCPPEIFKDNEYYPHVDSENAWAVALRFNPQAHHWMEIIKTGTPVALWMRETLHSTYHTFADSIVHTPKQWRELVSTERQTARKKPHGRTMTLLWDDWDRLPPNAIVNVQMISPRSAKP